MLVPYSFSRPPPPPLILLLSLSDFQPKFRTSFWLSFESLTRVTAMSTLKNLSISLFISLINILEYWDTRALFDELFVIFEQLDEPTGFRFRMVELVVDMLVDDDLGDVSIQSNSTDRFVGNVEV